MAQMNPPEPDHENQAGGDSPELYLDGRDEVPDQGRIPTEKVKSLDEMPLRRIAHTGDAVEDAGDESQKGLLRPLSFSRNEDFQGNEGAATQGTSAQSDLRDQGRDLGRRERITASQAFGRDVGVSGLPEGAFEDAEETIRRRAALASHNSDWTAVLGKLGGSSPGSQENLLLSEKFHGVKFPSSREDILLKLPPDAGFNVRTVWIDLREAVAGSRLGQFRSMNEIIDCVKDAIREAEHREHHPT